jgi:hypothetical protein
MPVLAAQLFLFLNYAGPCISLSKAICWWFISFGRKALCEMVSAHIFTTLPFSLHSSYRHLLPDPGKAPSSSV